MLRKGCVVDDMLVQAFVSGDWDGMGGGGGVCDFDFSEK